LTSSHRVQNHDFSKEAEAFEANRERELAERHYAKLEKQGFVVSKDTLAAARKADADTLAAARKADADTLTAARKADVESLRWAIMYLSCQEPL
jgi:hypothetical protein